MVGGLTWGHRRLGLRGIVAALTVFGLVALASATAVKERMAELQRYFPEGVAYEIPYDSSKFVKISITQVVETLLDLHRETASTLVLVTHDLALACKKWSGAWRR